MNDPLPHRLLVSERTAARLLCVSPRTMWSLADRGVIPFVKIGARKLYDLNTLRAWIKSQQVTPPTSVEGG